MKDRIKLLRNTLGLTQEKFGERLGIKRNTIATYEIGRNEPIDAVISLICREFNVNEDWLRNGTGGNDNMFVQPVENELISRAARILGERDPLFEAFVETYSQLNAANRKALLEFFTDFSDTLAKKKE